MNDFPKEPDPTVETITFHCDATQAASVFLVGDFNNWNPATHAMRRQADGSWSLQVPLARGHHYYRFLVDGEPALDPHAMYLTLQDAYKNVSFIAIS
jgi:1,4-alpha-glucan branching enzyme